jgi:hypothetical protein
MRGAVLSGGVEKSAPHARSGEGDTVVTAHPVPTAASRERRPVSSSALAHTRASSVAPPSDFTSAGSACSGGPSRRTMSSEPRARRLSRSAASAAAVPSAYGLMDSARHIL